MRTIMYARLRDVCLWGRGSWMKDEEKAVQKAVLLLLFHFSTNICKLRIIGFGFIVDFARRVNGRQIKGENKLWEVA